MFVSRSKYLKLLKEKLELEYQCERLLDKWNDVVRTINAKGGQAFLDRGTLEQNSIFSQSEIRILIQMCHPDKHPGKDSFAQITQKLLSLKE